MIIVTGCNARYYSRALPYLRSLREHADCQILLVCVGFSLDEGEKESLSPVQVVSLPSRLNLGAPPETESVQHGSFLHVLGCSADETIIYTDADFIMQRAMSEQERSFLSMREGEICIGYNFGPQCTLMHDALILGPKRALEMLPFEWGPVVHTAQDYNAGFMAATRATWETLYRDYLLNWKRVSDTFAHQARQQWLISYAIAALGVTVKLCPWSIHAHGHGGLKDGMTRGPDGIYVDGELALFRHYL